MRKSGLQTRRANNGADKRTEREQGEPEEEERKRDGTKLQRVPCLRNLDNVKDFRGVSKKREGGEDGSRLDGGENSFVKYRPGTTRSTLDISLATTYRDWW